MLAVFLDFLCDASFSTLQYHLYTRCPPKRLCQVAARERPYCPHTRFMRRQPTEPTSRCRPTERGSMCRRHIPLRNLPSSVRQVRSPVLAAGRQSPSPSFLFSFFKGYLFTGYRVRYAFWSGRYVRFLSAKLEVARQTPNHRHALTLKNRHWLCRVQFSNVRACLIASVCHLSGCLENRI